MKLTIPVDDALAESQLPDRKPDGSGVGVNYADAYLKQLKLTLEDGRKLVARRRGIRITLTLGDAKGEGLLRRHVHGPDPRDLLREALTEAALGMGAGMRLGAGVVEFDIP